MSQASLNAGLEIDQSIPVQTGLVAQVNTNQIEPPKVIVNPPEHQDALEQAREELEGTFEALDALMSVRSRIRDQRAMSRELALEALETAPELGLRPLASFTEAGTLVNRTHSLEQIDTYIGSLTEQVFDEQIAPFVEAVEQSHPKDVLIKNHAGFVERVQAISSKLDAYIYAYGADALISHQPGPTDTPALLECLSNGHLASLICAPGEAKQILPVLTMPSVAITMAREWLSGLTKQLTDAITSGSPEQVVSVVREFSAGIEQTCEQLAQLPQFDLHDSGSLELSQAALTNTGAFCWAFKSGLEGLQDWERWSTQARTNLTLDTEALKALTPGLTALPTDVQVAVAGTVAQASSLYEQANQALTNRIVFCGHLVNYLQAWTKTLRTEQ